MYTGLGPVSPSHPHILTLRQQQYHTTSTHTGLTKSAVPNSIMPIKYSFWRKSSERAGPYETHSRSEHANLDIVIASTIRNAPADVLTDQGTYLCDASEPIEHADSADEANPARDIAGSERDAPDDTLRREPETAELKDNIYPLGGEQENYPDAGEAIGVVKECKEQCRNLCENPWAPFACAQGFKIAS